MIPRTFPPSPDVETSIPPIDPDAPAVPYWPASAGLDRTDNDFDRQHPDYLETP